MYYMHFSPCKILPEISPTMRKSRRDLAEILAENEISPRSRRDLGETRSLVKISPRFSQSMWSRRDEHVISPRFTRSRRSRRDLGENEKISPRFSRRTRYRQDFHQDLGRDVSRSCRDYKDLGENEKKSRGERDLIARSRESRRDAFKISASVPRSRCDLEIDRDFGEKYY